MTDAGCNLIKYARSSVGKKQLMGISGLLLCGFLVMHLLGNFLIFKGPEAFNSYGHKLITMPGALFMELALLFLFLFHIAMGITLTVQNEAARSQKYFMKVRTGRGATLASSTMPYTGLIIMAFLISHMVQFRFGPHYDVYYDGVLMRDLYTVTIEVFSKWYNVFWYVFSIWALTLHLSHGFSSAFQSLGFNHPRYTPFLHCLAKVYAVIIGIGFASIPLWVFFNKGVR